MEQNENLNVHELADYLRIGICKAYAMTHEPGFPAVWVGKRKVIIPKAELDKWLSERAGKGR